MWERNQSNTAINRTERFRKCFMLMMILELLEGKDETIETIINTSFLQPARSDLGGRSVDRIMDVLSRTNATDLHMGAL